MLSAGDQAPPFTLLDQNGRKVSLSDFAGRPLVVFFYPKADTSGCTAQACGLRDANVSGEFGDAVVVGISPDPPAKQSRFDEKHALGFPLLADTDHAVAEAWGVWGEKTMYGRKYMGIIRSAFVLDGEGRIVDARYGISPKDTPAFALKALSGSSASG